MLKPFPLQLKKDQTMTTPPQQQEQEPNNNKRRKCVNCNDKTAVLYCRADAAKLCVSCDAVVHSTNTLFSKHVRSHLCDLCDTSPASIFCGTHHSVLCHNCDWESHTRCPGHDRRPIEWFSGCPSASELAMSFGFDDLDWEEEKNQEEGVVDWGGPGFGSSPCIDDGVLDLFVWETSPVFSSIGDLIVSSDSDRSFPALGVPPLPKNRNAVCGKYKEELVRQLRELGRAKPDSYYEKVAMNVLESLPAVQHIHLQDNLGHLIPEENVLQWLNETGEAANDTDGTKPRHIPTDKTVPDDPKLKPYELNSQERDSAISRYREKRKTRRFDNHIRYHSRKIGAHSRTRINGRFAKKLNVDK